MSPGVPGKGGNGAEQFDRRITTGINNSRTREQRVTSFGLVQFCLVLLKSLIFQTTNLYNRIVNENYLPKASTMVNDHNIPSIFLNNRSFPHHS